jgi:hypothetical protein
MRPRPLALVVAALIFAACGTPAPSVVSVPARVGPSGLLIRLDVNTHSNGVGRHSVDYLTDGTVIRWVNGTACDRGQPCGALNRNALTASGLAALRALLAQDADLLAEPMVVKSQITPGTYPLRDGETTEVFVLERPDGTRYVVEAPSTTSSNAALWVPDPRITRLNALAEAMLHPETVIGAGGLAGPTWMQYQPSAMAVVVILSASAQPPAFDGPYGLDIQKTGWPLGGSPDTFGATFAPNVSTSLFTASAANTYRCAFLSYDDALKAITSLPDSGGSHALDRMAAGEVWGRGTLRWGDKVDFGMWAVALLPEDVAGSCDDAFTY